MGAPFSLSRSSRPHTEHNQQPHRGKPPACDFDTLKVVDIPNPAEFDPDTARTRWHGRLPGEWGRCLLMSRLEIILGRLQWAVTVFGGYI